MKTFKKVISLVLVFAMLASFAGMTGYVPTIKASATDALTSTTAPVDTKSGINKATIDMPPVLYTNSSGVIVNSAGGATLDTILDITLPSGVTSATLKAVAYESDSTVYMTWTLSAGANTVDFSGKTGTALTGGPAYLCLRLDYTMPVTNTPYNTPTGSIVDSTYEQASSLTNNPYIDNTYGDKSVADTVSVTYTQYIAAYVTALPRYKIAQFWGVENKYWGQTEKVSFYQRINLAPFIASSGFNIIYGDTGDSSTKGASGYSTAAPTWPTWFNGTLPDGSTGWDDYTYRYVQDPDEADSSNAHWLMGDNAVGKASDVSTSASIGATIYVDTQASGAQKSSISAPIYSLYDASGSAWSSMDSRPDFESGSSYYYFGTGTKGGTWNTYIVDATGDQTAGTNYTHMYFNGSSTNSWTSNAVQLSGNEKVGMSNNMVFYKAAYDDTATYLFYTRPQASGSHRTFCLYLGYYFEFIKVDRAAEHEVINAAISKNFVEAEMDATWWKEYRDEVLFAYFDCGDLQNVAGVQGLFDNAIANGYASSAPVYKVANYTDLGNAILNTPDYDRGNNERVTDATRIQPGAGHVSVINYASDPIGKTYGDYAGNGVNNLIDASIYRYSGAYFYTEDSWKTYATERYYAVNIFEYYNSTVPYQCFWYGSGVDTANKVSQTSYCYYQSTIDEATTRLVNAYNALELRTLGGLKMRNDYDGGGAWVYDSSGNQVVGYDAIIAYLESLIDKSTVKYYKGLKDTDGDDIKDTLEEATMQLYDTTALEEKLAAIKSTYSATDTVVDKGIAFEAAIADFLKEVDNTKNNKKTATSFAGWNALFTQLTEMADGSTTITTGNILNKFSDLYIDDDNGTVYSAIETVINNYNAFTESDTGYALNDQEELNGYVEDLYTALCTSLPSVAVNNAATDAKAYPATQTFKVYDYQIGESDHAPADVIQFTDDSITKLNNAADAAAAVTYPMLTTPVSTLTSAAATVTAMAALEADGGLLVNRPAVTDYLTIAADNAKTALYGSTTGTTGKTTTVTSPDGSESKTVSLYTAQSVAELEYVLNQAAAKLEEVKAGTKLWSAQLEIDQLTYALYEETTDDTPYLLGGMASAFGDYRTWTYADGVITAGELIWTPDAWNTLLYSTRGSAYKGSEKYGLQYDGAYYGFLDAEIVAPHTNDEGNRDDNYTVWNEDGSLVTVTAADGSTAYAGATVFTPETWGAYIAAYNTAKAVSRDLTLADQATVDNAAKALYDARNALQYNYFPSNKEGFEAAKALYANLEAYLVTTPITRYGYTIDAETGALVEATALDTCQVNVNIYSNITPEFENAIVAFEAKYASDTSTEPFDSLAAAQELYDSIIATYVNSETAPIALKKTDDSSFYAGMQDLVDNYIAGDWDGTAYTSDLLNGTQVKELGQKLTDAQAMFNSEKDAYVSPTQFGQDLATQTNLVFTYTQNNAYDLQFATYMKDSELYPFLDLTLEGIVDYYYENGSYEYKVFDETVVSDIKAGVDVYFGEENASKWPLIYEVNGMEWNADGEAAVVTGYEAVSNIYSGDIQEIADILTAVGSHSSNYIQALTLGLKSYNSAPYFWLLGNAFGVHDSVDVVLGDVSAVRTDSKVAPFNYDVTRDDTNMVGWYTDGYGLNETKYYDYTWFTDETVNLVNQYRYDEYGIAAGVGVETIEELRELQIGSSYAEYVGGGTAYIDEIKKNGWTQTAYSAWFNECIIIDQQMIDGFANELYDAIYGLELRKARDAYREVEELYQHAMGKIITEWEDGENSFTGSTGAAANTIFFNVSEAFLNRVGPYVLADDGKSGTTTNNLYEQYKKEGEAWESLTAFYDSFINTAEADMITIDKAALVNGTNENGTVESLKEELIAILNDLELVDLDFTLLNTLVDAFLGDKLTSLYNTETVKIYEEAGFQINSSYGEFFPIDYYTDESLLAVGDLLMNSPAVLASGKVVKYVNGTPAWVDTFDFGITYDESYYGDFYSNVALQDEIDGTEDSKVKSLIDALNNTLVLKPVDTDGLVAAIDQGDAIIAAKYDTTDVTWETYETELANAKALLEVCTDYDIRKQSEIDTQEENLLQAIANLKPLADDLAPVMSILTSASAVDAFYSEYNALLSTVDTALTDDNASTNPVAGTFFIPNNGACSLMVYTNELNPRIVIDLEDIAKVLDEVNGVYQESAKGEYISIKAKKTKDTVTNVIAGLISSTGAMSFVTDADNAVTSIGEATATNYITVSNPDVTEGSSVFAILAPTFVSGKNAQAAQYEITARDASARTTADGSTLEGNAVDHLDLRTGQDAVELTNSGNITVYIYYHNVMSDTNDEGIDSTGTATQPANDSTTVASVYLSGEPSYDGAWRNGLLLTRSFSDRHRSWEYVSPVINHEVNGVVGVPVYNDPTFGDLNTGSFYYVLDREAATGTVDGDIIAAYTDAKNSAEGLMDYDAATIAKQTMIAKMTSELYAAMKESGRYYSYGDYQREADGSIKYSGTTPLTINWAQSLNDKVENGDLVFVHVVDRWGNVVNRIIEITNLDMIAPDVNAPASGQIEIKETEETGGSGIADIQVHNGDFSLGDFDYAVSSEQNVEYGLDNQQITNSAKVTCSGNELTITGLVPGKTYYISAVDNAGNKNSAAVQAVETEKADGTKTGTITLTITNTVVTTESDDAIATTFTLNGTDTIILNSGEASSVIDASLEGNVFANRAIRHVVTTYDNVTQLKTVYQDGTVEEWTADNATVTDNGDGTLTWVIKRTLAEGEHNYKVYAMVDGEYESFYAPATITATTKSVKITYRVIGMGKTVLNYSGSIAIKNSTYNSLTVPYGSEVTITADTNVEGCEFYYWINNYTERIISTANVYAFKAVTNVDYIAQFTNSATYYDGKKLVVYVNNAKNVIERFELAEGDTYTVPAGPVLPDYTFKGWSMTQEEVLASDKDTVIVEPIYTLSAENTVTITQGNYTATGAGTYTAEENQRAVVTVSVSANDNDGNQFLYWLDDDTDEIVSYDRTYSFFCVKDTVLTPVYGDASTIEVAPVVRITEVRYSALSGKVSFFAERSVPEEFTLLQTGIVVTKTESIGTNDEVFVVGGTSTAAGTSTSTANNGYYSASTAISTGQTVWARAYAIYETADGEILEAYGPVTSYTVE